MSHYRSNVRDLEFALFEVFGRGDVLGHGPYEAVDADTAREMLHEVARLAEHELADSLLDSDRNPPVYDPASHTVTLPESFKRSYAAYLESGFWAIDVPAELGGTVVPPSLRWAVNELILGSNPAVGHDRVELLLRQAAPHPRHRRAEEAGRLMVDRKWTATMVLTEPDAGSDVGAGRTKAVQNADGTWNITGVKRFITSAEMDLSDNIVHFVLARPEGAGPGTKGLSLFVVPKFHIVDLDTGELGERNGAVITNVEHKMGLKVSTTCEVTFGDGTPAVGTLLGDVHDGIAQMFRVIEHARMMVGTKSIATLSTGYLNALDYAKQRVQGADLTQQADKTAPRVTITHHPDVRRSLMLQKSYAEGLRALVLYTATQQDAVEAAQLAAGSEELPEDSPAQLARRVNDLLLPSSRRSAPSGRGCSSAPSRCRRSAGPGSSRTTRSSSTSGTPRSTPSTRAPRRSRGSTSSSARSSRTRASRSPTWPCRSRSSPRTWESAAARSTRSASCSGRPRPTSRGSSSTSAPRRSSPSPRMGGEIRNVYKVGLNTSRLLLAAGDLVVGWLLLREAEVAQEALTSRGDTLSAKDRDFYTGKVAAARFYARNVLPRLAAERVIAEGTDDSIMDLPESAF